MRRVPPAALLAALATLPAAGVAGPELTLVLDGETRRFVPQMDGGQTGFTRFISVDAVSIAGADGPARLVLELAFPPGARSGDAPHDARISYRPQGWRDYWVSPPAFPPGAVRVEHLDLSGPSPRITGSFALALCATATPMQQPDLTRCRTVSGRFDTPLVPD